MKVKTNVYKRIVFTSGLIIAFIFLCSCGKEIKAENDKLHQEVQALSKQNGDLEIDLEKAKLRIEAEQNNISELTAKLSGLERSIEELRNQLAVQDTQERMNRKGELVGVISYYFNTNYGYMSDTGSDVYIWKQDQYPDFDPDVFTKFIYSKSALTEEQEDKFEAMMWTVEIGKETIEATVDGNGSFQRKLSPGKYFVLVRSAHRTNDNAVERSGMLSLHSVEIEPSEQSYIDRKFYIY